MTDPIAQRAYAQEQDVGVAIPCVITAVDLSGEPMVSVRPLQPTRIVSFDGEIELLDPIEIAEVPYAFASSSDFAAFVPPKVGMHGLLIVTDHEVGEVAGARREIVRSKDRASGFFLPGPHFSGPVFRGNAEWAELRGDDTRVAVSADKVHLEAGSTSVVVTSAGEFDVVVNGQSLIAALKQMSAHIRALEALVHPNGMTHGPVKARMIDQFTAAAVPARTERGAR